MGGGQLGLGLGGGDVEAPGLDHAGHGVPVQVLGIVSNVRTVASDSQINTFSNVLSHSNGRCAVSPCYSQYGALLCRTHLQSQ